MAKLKKKLTKTLQRQIVLRHENGEAKGALCAAFEITERHLDRIIANAATGALTRRIPTRVLTFRASHSDIAAFEIARTEAGYATTSDAFRALLRISAGLFELPRVQRQALNLALQDLHKPGININQIAREIHKGKVIIKSDHLDVFRALQKALSDTKSALAQIDGRIRRDAHDLLTAARSDPS